MFLSYLTKFLDIVPFVAKPFKVRFDVFLKWLLIVYFRLYKGRQLAPQGLIIGEKLQRKYEVSPPKGRCHERDYTQILLFGRG